MMIVIILSVIQQCRGAIFLNGKKLSTAVEKGTKSKRVKRFATKIEIGDEYDHLKLLPVNFSFLCNKLERFPVGRNNICW
jgi:hypothetical protein